LALFALCLNLIAALLPPPAVAAFIGNEGPLLCSSNDEADGGESPAKPGRHHHCQDCLAQKIGGNANLPEPAATLLNLPSAAPLFPAVDQIAVAAGATANAQPRAPPSIG
jgi:hypothetical protein